MHTLAQLQRYAVNLLEEHVRDNFAECACYLPLLVQALKYSTEAIDGPLWQILVDWAKRDLVGSRRC